MRSRLLVQARSYEPSAPATPFFNTKASNMSVTPARPALELKLELRLVRLSSRSAILMGYAMAIMLIQMVAVSELVSPLNLVGR